MRKILILFCTIGIWALSIAAQAHELDKLSVMHKRNKELAAYDMCLSKAQKDTTAEKACRQKYALQRLTTPEKLLHVYMQHPLIADDAYTDILLGIEGKIFSVGKSNMGYPEVNMSVDGFGVQGVRCEFSKQYAKDVSKLKAGTTVRLLGISKGLVHDKYVYMTHCEVMQ